MEKMSLSRQAAMLSGAESFRFLIKSIIGIVLARVLSTQDYGSYRQLFLIYTTFSTILLLGIPQSMMYFLPKLGDNEQKRKLVSRTVDLISILSILMCLGIVAFRGLIAQAFSNPDIKDLLLVFSVYPIFVFITQIYSTIMMGLKQTKQVVRFTAFSVIGDSLLIVGVALLSRSLIWIVLGVLASALSQWIYVRIKLLKESCKYEWNPAAYRDLLAYSLPLGLSSIIGILAIQLDKFVISGYFTPAQYAVFAVGAMELPFIGILVNSVNAVVLPALSSMKDPDEVYQVYRGAVRKNALIIFPVAALTFLLASDIISFLYTGRYSGASPYFRIYIFTILIRIASYGIIFQALNKTRYIMMNAIFTLVLNLVLNLVLVNTSLKMMGPALATVIVTYCSAVLYLWWIHGKLHFSLRKLFPVFQLLKTLAAAALAALVSGAALFLVSGHFFRLIVGSAVFAVVYLGFAILVGAILPYDITSMREGLAGLERKLKRG